jgi:hypothetical protein
MYGRFEWVWDDDGAGVASLAGFGCVVAGGESPPAGLGLEDGVAGEGDFGGEVVEDGDEEVEAGGAEGLGVGGEFVVVRLQGGASCVGCAAVGVLAGFDEAFRDPLRIHAGSSGLMTRWLMNHASSYSCAGLSTSVSFMR